MYKLKDGSSVSAMDIGAAFKAGRAVIVHTRREGDSKAGLLLNGVHFDTRGKCYHALDETWTTLPQTLTEALDAADYNPYPFCTIYKPDICSGLLNPLAAETRFDHGFSMKL
jgi:hypothetical protein